MRPLAKVEHSRWNAVSIIEGFRPIMPHETEKARATSFLGPESGSRTVSRKNAFVFSFTCSMLIDSGVAFDEYWNHFGTTKGIGSPASLLSKSDNDPPKGKLSDWLPLVSPESLVGIVMPAELVERMDPLKATAMGAEVSSPRGGGWLGSKE